jgi:repressor of nif and glnA expression
LNGLGNQIEKDIIKVINSSEHPVSSREIALKINRAWHSVNTHCLRLQITGKVNGYKIGNMNVWSKI